MLDLAGGNICDDSFEIELFIVKSGPAIFDAKLGYYEKDARGFEVFVGQAIGAKQFGSAHLEIDGIDAVVNYAALVGFTVSRLNGYRAGFNLCMVWESHQVIAPRGSYIVFRNILRTQRIPKPGRVCQNIQLTYGCCYEKITALCFNGNVPNLYATKGYPNES